MGPDAAAGPLPTSSPGWSALPVGSPPGWGQGKAMTSIPFPATLLRILSMEGGKWRDTEVPLGEGGHLGICSQASVCHLYPFSLSLPP